MELAPQYQNIGPIGNESIIVIIGGGPAGSSCAIKLKKLCIQKNIHPRIVVYEGKRFDKKSYYNQCLGVLSPPLDKIMEEELDTPFPHYIIQKKINGYYVCSENICIKLEGEHDPSYSCRRVEFDHYLFQAAKELGIETLSARVTELDFNPNGVMVFSESNNIHADVVVGAFGLDDGMAKTFERMTPYRQPKFLSSVVTKIHPGTEAVDKFGYYIHAFLPSSLSGIEFGAITPKGNHLSVNVAGLKVNAEMMDKFLQLPVVKQVLPERINKIQPELYYFKGKFPTLPAKGFIGDRYVMIGDASGLNRPFKGKGINSAVITGIKAAETMVNAGISREAFKEYLTSCCELTDDIPYGRGLRFSANLTKRFAFMDNIISLAEQEPALKKVLFNIVSGQETYKKTWHEAGRFTFFLKIGLKALKRKIFRS